MRNGDCSHICDNQPGTHQCLCPENLSLSSDGYTCEGDSADLFVILIFSNLSEIESCTNKNGGCDQECGYDLNGVVVCSCESGYKLDEDKRHCRGWSSDAGDVEDKELILVDIDECAHSSGGNCQQICINTPGSWRCECREGYKTRNDDHFKCEPVCSTPCLNNGVCIAPNRCFCPPGYPGPDCTGISGPI